MKLMQPMVLGRLALPNRVVMAPMTRSRAERGKLPGAQTARYYVQRASAGLIVSEATHISEETSHSELTAGIYSAGQIEAWARVAEAVHQAGGRIFLQLWHLGRARHGGRYPPVGPSAVPARVTRSDATGTVRPLPVPVQLDEAGIRTIVGDYRAAAVNAVAAGLDGVEIHAANGFLIDQFLRDGANRRSDRYGGTPARRVRFLQEVAEAVCSAVGPDRVGVRLSPGKSFNDMHDSTPFETFGAAVACLNPLGLAYLHLACDPPGAADRLPFTDALTQAMRAQFSGAVILNGGYTRERAEQAVASGAADMISFASAYIANPDLVQRLREGARLNPVNQARIYGGGPDGYIDYPTLDDRLPPEPGDG